MFKEWTLLWHEAHFQVKRWKTPQPRSTLGSWDVEKHRRHCGAKQKCRSQMYKTHHSPSTLTCFKSARCCGAKQISKSKFSKHHIMFGPLLDVRRLVWQAPRIMQLAQSEPHMCGFCSSFKHDGRLGAFEDDLERCNPRGGRSTRDTWVRHGVRPGRWSLETGCILDDQICRFAKMIWRDRCSTSYDLTSHFRGRRGTLDTWSGIRAKQIGTRPSVLHSTFHFWRKSRRISSLLTLSISKLEEALQSFIVLDLWTFTFWGSLAELLRFGAVRNHFLRNSRRAASFQINRWMDR